MSEPLNVDDEVIFLYNKLMKEDQICDFKFMDSIMLLLIIYQLHLLVHGKWRWFPRTMLYQLEHCK